MNEMIMMLLMGNRGVDRVRLAGYLRDERNKREKDYAKIARAVTFGAFYFWGGLKLKVQNATGTVPATDPSVTATGKLDAILAGIEETAKTIPYFGLVNEVATFVGEVIARSSTVDPALLEMLVSNGNQQPQQIVFNPGYQQPRQLTITSPTGQVGQFRLGANGIEITDPNWGVRVD